MNNRVILSLVAFFIACSTWTVQAQKNKEVNMKTSKILVAYFSVTGTTENVAKNIAEITEQKLGFPVFVKPSNSGSSVGIKKANNIEELEDAIKYASNYDTKILIEEEIIGREIECAVLGNTDVKATCVGEILPAEDFYTFDAKYNNAQSRVVIPAEVEQQKQDEIKELAIKAFKAVDGKGLSRVDFFIRKSDNKVYINEINTLPGFTQISMYPKLWEQCGIEYSKLLDELIKLAQN